MVCSATNGLRLILDFHSTTISRQFLTRSGLFATQQGSAIGCRSVKVLALRVIFARIAHLTSEVALTPR